LWKDRRRNVDILKELSIERHYQCNTVSTSHFGHLTRMKHDRLPYILLHYYHMKSEEKEDRRKDGLITFVMTLWASELQYRKLLI